MTVYDNDEFDNPEEEIAYNKELLKALQRRKRALGVQKAEYGIAFPAHLRSELEGVNAEIQQLQQRINQLEGGTPPPPQRPYKLTSSRGPTLLPATFPATDWAHEPPEVAMFAVLQMINNFERERPGYFVNDAQVADALEMDLQDVRNYMDLLEGAGHTKAANSHDGHRARLTAEGRERLYSSSNRPSRDVEALSDQDRQVLAHINREMQSTSEAIAKATGLDHAVVVISVLRLARKQLVTMTPTLKGLGARITPKGAQALQ